MRHFKTIIYYYFGQKMRLKPGGIKFVITADNKII